MSQLDKAERTLARPHGAACPPRTCAKYGGKSPHGDRISKAARKIYAKWAKAAKRARRRAGKLLAVEA